VALPLAVDEMLSRRKFLQTTFGVAPAAGGLGAALLCLDPLSWFGWDAAGAFSQSPSDLARTAPRARYWTSVALAGADCSACHTPGTNLPSGHVHQKGVVKCLLCARLCTIKPGDRGMCRARMNVNGELRSLVYGRPMSIHVDPIEKKPFYHFLPGSAAFSLCTSGCPLRCRFCQNWEISQASPEDYQASYTAASDITSAASSRKAPVIAFTYNEPTVFTEYLTDVARDARKRRLRSVMVSCGFMNEAPLAEMCDVLDAIKIDLKGYSETFYRNVCGAELKPVLRSIKQIASRGVHLEIVNLVVPTLNDSDASLQGLVSWVAGELGPDVPVHFTRFHPDYQLLNLPDTPVATLERAREMALAKGLHYPYVGNVPDHPGNHTYCPGCRKIVVQRSGFFVTAVNISDGRCAFCKTKIAGVWT
jgi:pyruvate formate lyase activating enzyme